jgi:hypothetical protein
VNSEYFWWLAVFALVAGGGLLALLSWQPETHDVDDDPWEPEDDGSRGVA